MIGEWGAPVWCTAGTPSDWRWPRPPGFCRTSSPSWAGRSCDHTGPVAEGDTLYSDLHIERADPLPGDRGGVFTLRSEVCAVSEDGPDRPVLDWRFTALHF